MNTTTSVVILIVVIAAVAAGIFVFLRTRSQRLRTRFGPEYDRTVQETGSRYRAEAKLQKLEKRVEGFAIHPLRPEDAARFRDAWRALQTRFVDDPKVAVSEADQLLGQVMTERGYPVSNFDERSSEISVNHPVVAENYRAGHEIALRHAQGKASTEDMRQAMIHYRMLFEELVGEPEKARVQTAGSKA
jgi:hypothetical protein